MHYDSDGKAWVAESRDELFGWTIVNEVFFKPGVTQAAIERTNDGVPERRLVYINDPMAELSFYERRIESVVDNASMQAADMIETQLKRELRRIQAKHLRRHTIELMGVGLYVYAGKWDVNRDIYELRKRIKLFRGEVPEWLEQLEGLLSWYCRVADYARASCEIELPPLPPPVAS